MKIIAYIIYGVSQALYKLFGVNTPLRKAWLAYKARKIQEQLDYEHHIRDMVNRKVSGNYTTKRAIEVAKCNDWC